MNIKKILLCILVFHSMVMTSSPAYISLEDYRDKINLSVEVNIIRVYAENRTMADAVVKKVFKGEAKILDTLRIIMNMLRSLIYDAGDHLLFL